MLTWSIPRRFVSVGELKLAFFSFHLFLVSSLTGGGGRSNKNATAGASCHFFGLQRDGRPTVTHQIVRDKQQNVLILKTETFLIFGRPIQPQNERWQLFASSSLGHFSAPLPRYT